MAPAARLLPVQVSCVRLNGAATARFNAVAAMLPPLVTVTVCAALAWPGSAAGKVNWSGVTVNSGGSRPVPERATVCGWLRVTSATVSVPV